MLSNERCMLHRIGCIFFLKENGAPHARNPPLRRSSRLPRRTYEKDRLRLKGFGRHYVRGVPASVRNLGSHSLAAWRPYKRHTVFESVLYVKKVKGEGTRCLIQEQGDYPQPHADLPFKMAIAIPAGILEELKISIQCPYREPDGRRDRKGRINRTRFRSPRLLLSSSGSASHWASPAWSSGSGEFV
jgi:hypothetical protein